MSWLERTQQLYNEGTAKLSFRELATRARMSHTHISNILSGRTVPSLPVLFALLNALTTDSHVIQSILNQFSREVPSHREQSTQTVHRPSQGDILALTAAITELNGLLREVLQEMRR